MIKNWNFHNLFIDFSSYTSSQNHPSDIDMSYIAKDDTWIIGEIKNEKGKLTKGQRSLLEKYVNNWKHNAICLFIVHDKYVQLGDKKVDAINCKVKEMYLKEEGFWRIPKKEITVKEILEYYDRRR